MDQSNKAEDTREQPWKKWAKEELDARKKANKTEEGRKVQEERLKAYIRKNDEDESEAYDTNKAG